MKDKHSFITQKTEPNINKPIFVYGFRFRDLAIVGALTVFLLIARNILLFIPAWFPILLATFLLLFFFLCNKQADRKRRNDPDFFFTLLVRFFSQEKYDFNKKTPLPSLFHNHEDR